jgi:hypothetical protein
MHSKKDSIKNRVIYRKLLNTSIVVVLILASFTIFFVETVKAQGYTNEIMVIPSSINVTVGDTFNLHIYTNVSWEITNVTISNVTFEPAGRLNYTSTLQGDLFSGGQWLSPESPGSYPGGGIYNSSGYALPIAWNDTAVNNTFNKMANVTWYANGVGLAYINITGATYNDSGTNHSTSLQNATVLIHPQCPSTFTAATLTDTRIRLNFTKGLGADNTTIRRAIGPPPQNITDGTEVYNSTGTSYEDSGLTPGTQYGYSAWGWNATEGLYSLWASGNGSNTYQGGPGWLLQEHYSDIADRYIENNTEKKFNFSFVTEEMGPTQSLHNLTIILPTNLTLVGDTNGTTVSSGYTVYNTSDKVIWNATDYASGFSCAGTKYFWFNASALGGLGSYNFQVIAYSSYSEYQSFNMSVFITTNFSFTGSIVDINGNVLEGATANIAVSSFSQNGPPVTLGYFTADTNSTGHFNVTGIPATVNVSGLKQENKSMGPGGGGLFYSLSAAEYEPTDTYAINISTSLPSLPIGEFVTMLDNPEIYLKPAISFRVNVTGPNYNWSIPGPNKIQNYSAKSFQIMVKDLRLGYSVKELFTNSLEKIFSVPAGRNYSLSIFPSQSFPASVRFQNIISTLESTGNLNQSGVIVYNWSYNGTYLLNVSVNASYVHKYLNGSFNGISSITDMRIVAYIMEDEDMIFENWALPFNLANETGGNDDSYDTLTGVYNISLPATIASSSIMLRAYARNSSGYYMGSHIINASSGNLNESTYNFTMYPLIDGENKSISSNNVSGQWNSTVIVNTTAVTFNLVNSTGSPLSNENAFVDVKRELEGVGYTYMTDAQNGQFNISLTEGSSLKKLTIYSQQYVPVSTYVSADVLSGSTSTDTISCSNGVCNITMRSFGDYDPLGENKSFFMGMYTSNSTCNVPNSPLICDLCGNQNESEFSPFNAILKGDVSLMISNGNISVYYLNVDLLASGPPDACFDNGTESGGGLEAAWQFGSQGPDIYDAVLIKMPYPDNLIGKTINVSIPVLYDNEFNEIWNSSVNTTADILSDPRLSDYTDYLGTTYEAYLNGTGVICSESDPTLSSGLGYKDAGNQTIWIKIPHFSGVGPLIAGIPPDIPTSFTATKSGTSQINLNWTKGSKADYTHVRRKTGSYPTSINDGTNVTNTTGTSKSDTGLSAGTTYYYSAWSWNATEGLWSESYATDSATTDSESGDGDGDDGDGDQESDDNGADEINTTSVIADHSISANDTDGDGVIDTFNDPTGELDDERLINISGNITFLISVNGSLDELYLWDTSSNTVNEVTHNVGTVSKTVTDTINETITVTITVNKSDWIYIEVTDEHPEKSNLTIETSDGRVISSDMIWRENDKIYVLDDPDTTYNFTYYYDILPPAFNPASGTSFNTRTPTINITYNETVTVTTATLKDETITLVTTDNQTFSYTPSSNLSNGEYTLSITVKDVDNNTRTDTATYTIAVEEPTPIGDTVTPIDPLTIAIIIIAIIAIIVIIVMLLFKYGYLYIETETRTGKTKKKRK